MTAIPSTWHKMMKSILCLVVCFFLSGCRDNNQPRHTPNSLQEISEAERSYPLLVDSGTKIVYQFGHMTPDKGLKLYYDTIPNPVGGLTMDESVRRKLSGQ